MFTHRNVYRFLCISPSCSAKPIDFSKHFSFSFYFLPTTHFCRQILRVFYSDIYFMLAHRDLFYLSSFYLKLLFCNFFKQLCEFLNEIPKRNISDRSHEQNLKFLWHIFVGFKGC